MLDVEQSKVRQGRLRDEMAEHRIDLAVVSDYRHVYYLTASLVDPQQPVVLLLSSDGATTLIAPEGRLHVAADQVVVYPTFSVEKLIDDIVCDAATLLEEALRRFKPPLRMFVETSALPARLAAVLKDRIPQVDWVDLRPTMLRLRKRKDPDEIECIQESIRLTEVGYAAARRAIAVGKMEIDIHAAMYQAMAEKLGTSFRFDGDFAVGQRADRGGGPPTSRKIEPNDLYILDIFPRINGYACDLCRTFAVGEPTNVQREAWQLVHNTLNEVVNLIEPGIAGGQIRAEVEGRLHGSQLSRNSFFHHAGHGIGLQPHESPRMIIGCDHVMEVGDLFTLEPGIYGPHLQGGIRLEHNYVLAPDGPKQLDTFPMDL
jgi:Xaa-Pro aminopeptidase